MGLPVAGINLTSILPTLVITLTPLTSLGSVAGPSITITPATAATAAIGKGAAGTAATAVLSPGVSYQVTAAGVYNGQALSFQPGTLVTINNSPQVLPSAVSASSASFKAAKTAGMGFTPINVTSGGLQTGETSDPTAAFSPQSASSSSKSETNVSSTGVGLLSGSGIVIAGEVSINALNTYQPNYSINWAKVFDDSLKAVKALAESSFYDEQPNTGKIPTNANESGKRDRK